MGYRSDVAIGMSFKNREALVAFLSAVRLGDAIPSEELDQYEVTDAGELGVLLHANFLGVKWYDSYPDVKCHHNLLDMAAERGAGTAFIRIGEEYNDITYEIDTADVDLDLYDFFGVSRQVTYPEDGTAIADYMKDTTCQTSTATSTR